MGVIHVDDVTTLTVGALDWLVASARETVNGLAWPETAADDKPDLTLYSGTAGIVLTLLEGHRHFGDDRYGDAALRGARELAATVGQTQNSSLYAGITGMAVASHAVGELLGDESAGAAAISALDLVRARFDGTRWAENFELLLGNAGIAVGALSVGDVALAELAVAPYLRTAEPTPNGVQWEVRAGRSGRPHHVSHGTLGIAYALAAVGHATGRAELTEMALAGVADVVARNEAGPAGFLVAHSDPPYSPELNPRYSYGWCHGPTGDAHVFRLLDAIDPVWSGLAHRCWYTITRSGLPHRKRPGFWDNNGHCCGTAGVLALACDRLVEKRDDPEFATLLVADLSTRATVDADGVRWSNHEHRRTPSDLPPATGWAMGNAGIIRELVRYIRITTAQDPAYAYPWPDHPPASGQV